MLAINHAPHHRRGSSKRPTDALDVLNGHVDELLAPRMTDSEIDALLRHDDDDVIRIDADVRALRDAFRLELNAATKTLGEVIGNVFCNALDSSDKHLAEILGSFATRPDAIQEQLADLMKVQRASGSQSAHEHAGQGAAGASSFGDRR